MVGGTVDSQAVQSRQHPRAGDDLLDLLRPNVELLPSPGGADTLGHPLRVHEDGLHPALDSVEIVHGVAHATSGTMKANG